MKELENRISSREVAEMMGKEHKNVLKKIDDLNKDLIGLNFSQSKYWVEGSYVDENNRTYREYQVTELGCELIAHKTIGKEGTAFTIKYMDRFHKMKDYITKEQYIVNKPKEELECLDIISNILHFNDNSKLLGVKTICNKYGMETGYLPEYTQSKDILKSATDLLKENNAEISIRKFNKKLVELGILKQCSRPSKKDNGKTKNFKNLVDTTWGENFVNPHDSRETQPLYYQSKFKELLEIVMKS